MSAKLLFYFLEKIMQGNCGKDVFAKWMLYCFLTISEMK